MGGFTLIETILTIMVLSVGIFGTMRLFYETAQRAAETDAYLQGTALAREKVEEIIFDKKMNLYPYVVSANYPVTEILSGNYSDYTRTLTILEVRPDDLTTAQNGSGYKRVTVTVSWSGGNMALTTLVTQWGEL